MSKVTLKGSPVSISGSFPENGSQAPDSILTNTSLADVSISSLSGKIRVLNIFPSIDTATCAASVRRFNKEASSLGNTVVLCISQDLPFAMSRFCGAEGLTNVESLSAFRSSFSESYGVNIADGPLKGLCARAVVILDARGTVVYTELVSEIAHEPDYPKALEAVAAVK